MEAQHCQALFALKLDLKVHALALLRREEMHSKHIVVSISLQRREVQVCKSSSFQGLAVLHARLSGVRVQDAHTSVHGKSLTLVCFVTL